MGTCIRNARIFVSLYSLAVNTGENFTKTSSFNAAATKGYKHTSPTKIGVKYVLTIVYVLFSLD